MPEIVKYPDQPPDAPTAPLGEAEREQRRQEFLEKLRGHIRQAEGIGALIDNFTNGRSQLAEALPGISDCRPVAANPQNVVEWQKVIDFLRSLEEYYETDLTSESVYTEWKKHFLKKGISPFEALGRLMSARFHDMRRRPAYYYALIQRLFTVFRS